MNIARIARDTGVVVNIECASQEWLDAHTDDPAFIFKPYGSEAVGLGRTYDPETGFAQPDTITITRTELAAAGVTPEQIAEFATPS
jgi:hypothetical protein